MKIEKLSEAFKVYDENMELVNNFILAAEAREIRMLIREHRPLATIRDKFGPFRKFLNDIYRVGLPMVLTFSVTCYEVFLKEALSILIDKKIEENYKINFFKPDEVRKEFGKIIKSDPLKGKNQLERNVRIAILKRNIIVHRAGKIDIKALNEFKELDITHYKEGEKLVLTTNEVKKDTQALREFVSTIFESISAYLGTL